MKDLCLDPLFIFLFSYGQLKMLYNGNYSRRESMAFISAILLGFKSPTLIPISYMIIYFFFTSIQEIKFLFL